MRNRNRRLMIALLTAVAQSGGGRSSKNTHDIYTVLPADLRAAEERVQGCEQEWRQAGGVRVAESQVDRALQNAKGLQSEFNQAKARSRPGLRLTYLRLVRLFVLTGLPRYEKAAIIGASGAIICALSLLLSPFVVSSLGTALAGALVLTAFGSCLMTATVFLLWPTENKRQSFQRLQHEWKDRKNKLETLRPSVVQAWTDYKVLRQHWILYNRLEKARQRREELAALLASVKYQLIHTDWRALRGVDFEHFLSRAFEMLGYHVQLTKASGDQGADLLITGKGARIAIQAKGYAHSVGNHSVMEVVAGMNYYQCTSCAVITNSRFTSTARHLAQANGCRLIDGAQIPDLIEGRIYY
jgi:HJR/Mrr/RecB family endonuclease